MIQRIQSIYLLLAGIALILMFSNPIAEIMISDEMVLVFKHNHIESPGNPDFQSVNTWPVTFILISVVAISFVNIFLYRSRILQMRLCVFNIILMFGLAGMIFFFSKVTLSHYDGQESAFLWPVVIPFISAVLTYLAFKRIQKDEILVKAYDRIR